MTPSDRNVNLSVMPSRIIPFVNGEIYHIYNRGSEKRPIFDTKVDRKRFLKTLRYYQLEGPKPKLSHFSESSLIQPDSSKKIVEIICYCLMPNHFHLMLKQIKDHGITEFMGKISNSYTKYYNTKHDRVGPLLQGEFKSVLVESEEQLIHLSRYIHLNPLVAFIVKSLDDYEWSSYEEFIKNLDGICLQEVILDLFKSKQDYQQFVLDQADYGKQLELIKHKLIEQI